MGDDIPQVWHLHFERNGITVSYRGLGAKARISHEAARRVVRGWPVKESTIRKVAAALVVDPEVVHDLRKDAPGLPMWEPPATSSLLSHDEREALSRLITLITLDRQESEHRDNGPSNTLASADHVTAEAHFYDGEPQSGASRPPDDRSPGQDQP